MIVINKMNVYLLISLDLLVFTNTSSYGRSAVAHTRHDLLINMPMSNNANKCVIMPLICSIRFLMHFSFFISHNNESNL